MKGVVYHYCSNETFLEVIKHKTLRLSDLNKTNDSMEKKYGYGLILDVLKEKFVEHKIKLDFNEKYFYEKGIESHSAAYHNEVESVLKDGRPILITCFSKNRDKLSQWRGYAGDGEGIAIGFNKKKLIELAKGQRDIISKDIVYDVKKGKDKIAKIIEKHIQGLKRLKDKSVLYKGQTLENIMENEFDEFCEELIKENENEICLIKNPAFKEEEEFRIIYNPNMTIFEALNLKEKELLFTEKKEIKGFVINPIDFNYRNGQLVAFCDISFANIVSEGIIEEIIIGPKSKLTKIDIRYFLVANGIDAEKVNIEKSSATYR